MTLQQIEISRSLVKGNIANLAGVRLIAIARKTEQETWSHITEMLVDLDDPANGGVLLAQMPPWCRAERMPDGWLIEDLETSEFGRTLAEACAKMLIRRAEKA